MRLKRRIAVAAISFLAGITLFYAVFSGSDWAFVTTLTLAIVLLLYAGDGSEHKGKWD